MMSQPHSNSGMGDGRSDELASGLRMPSEDEATETAEADETLLDLEPGWYAVQSLMRIKSDALLSMMLRPSFRPVGDHELVSVKPCHFCLDGGLRLAGSVRARKGRSLVRACDTCGLVQVEAPPLPPITH